MEDKLKKLEKLKKSNNIKMKILICLTAIVLVAILALVILITIKSRENSSIEDSKQQAIEIFNSKFTSYIGENISDQQVRVLISKVIEWDSTATRNEQVIISYGNYLYGDGETTLKPSIIPSDRTHIYSVNSIYNENGYINCIIIKDK